MPRRVSFAVRSRVGRGVAPCLNRLVAVLSPAEWRLDTTGTGLFLLEQQNDGKWWLRGLFFSLADAFDAAEQLHGPVTGVAARLAAWASRLGRRTEQRLIDVESPWAALVYRNAVERNPFQLEAIGAAANPLSPEQVARFVAARFTEAGRPLDTIEPEAIADMIQHSGRSPVEINALAGAAVFLADLEGAPRVSRQHVQHALAIRDERGIAVAAAQLPSELARSHGSLFSGWRLAVAMAGLLIVLSSSLAAKWLVLQPGDAAFDGVRARDALQVAGNVPPAPAMLPTPPAPVLVPKPAAAKSVPAPTVLAERVGPEQLAERPAPVRATAPVTASPQLLTALRADSPAVQQAAAVPAPRPAAMLASISTHDAPGLEQPSNSLGFFEGPVDNQTMNRSGRLALAITKEPASGTIRASFHAGEGLLGSGELAGNITPDGRISATGVLMMGHNAFICELSGQLVGRQLVGSAQFVRPWGGRIAHSVFKLVRS